MPPTLASLVQHSALRLKVRAGADRLATPVRWAHASELADPVPYMDGGELLLVTATNLDAEDPETMRRYVRRLVAAEVAGLGFAVGVTYDEVPAALVDAAEEAGLPLLEVPRRTPFIAISKAVSAAIAADQYRAVTAGFEAQRELTRAALVGEGPAGLITRLAAQVDGWAALYDTSGAVVAVAPDWAARRAGRLTGDVRRLGDRAAPASAVVGGPEDRVELQQPFDQPQEHLRVAQQVIRVAAVGRALYARLGAGPPVGTGGEVGAPLGEFGCRVRQDLPGAADPLPAPAGLGPAAGGQDGGRGAQGREMGGGVPLVRYVEGARLVDARPGLGEEIERGGRCRRAAQDGVDVGCRTVQRGGRAACAAPRGGGCGRAGHDEPPVVG